MANTVTFRLEGDQAKAVQSFLKVVEAQNKAVSGMKRIKDEAGYAESAMSKFGGSMKSWAAGLVGLGTVTAAISGIGMEITRIGQAKSSFEDAMTPLLSLGDNIDRIDSLKASVLSLSAASGIGAEKIANLLYTAEGNASGLSKSIQDDLVKSTIILSKTTGTDLDVALKALTKTFRAYGDEVNDVATIMSKLAVVGDKGSATFQEMANYLPDILPATKALGVDMDTVFATIIAGTNQLGRTEKTFTGIRNVFVRMSKAVEQGLVPQGDFLSQLEAISTASPEEMIKAFGEEGFTAASAIRSVADEVVRLKAEMAGIRGDDLSGKIIRRTGDVNYARAERAKRATAIMAGMDVTGGMFGAKVGDNEVAQLGMKNLAGGVGIPGSVGAGAVPWMQALGKLSPPAFYLLGGAKAAGDLAMQRSLAESGDYAGAMAEKIRAGTTGSFGEVSRASVANLRLKNFMSADPEAQRVAAAGYQFKTYLGGDSGETEAARFLSFYEKFSRDQSMQAAVMREFIDVMKRNTTVTAENTVKTAPSGGAFKPVNAGDRG